jgi:hypothetical protein
MSGQLEIRPNNRAFQSKIGDDARLFLSLYKVFIFIYYIYHASPPPLVLKTWKISVMYKDFFWLFVNMKKEIFFRSE